MTTTLVILLIIAFGIGLFAGTVLMSSLMSSEGKKTYPELERKVLLLLVACNDAKEIESFIFSKIDYLTSESFNALCSKIQEINNNKLIDEKENDLKLRIDSLSQIEEKSIVEVERICK